MLRRPHDSAQLRREDPTACWERARARARARLGQWDQAKSDDARAVALSPVGMSAVWYDYAGACVQAGDLPGCREVCRRLLSRPEPAHPDESFWVARACILAPDAVGDWRQPLHLAEAAAANEATPWRLYVLAAASYRAGRYGETVCLCGKSMEAGPWQAVCLDYLLLAMAHHRLGDEDVARAWLVKATQEIETAEKARREQGADAPIAAFAAYCDWLDYQILHREAEALLADK
jgi:tetratricopeptide (TPR) repeat protein